MKVFDICFFFFVKVKVFDWMYKFCEDIIRINGSLNVDVNFNGDYGYSFVFWILVFFVLGVVMDRELEVRL